MAKPRAKAKEINMKKLILAGASPRGMSYLLRAARVAAWLNGRDMVVPEDLREVVDFTQACIAWTPAQRFDYGLETVLAGLEWRLSRA